MYIILYFPIQVQGYKLENKLRLKILQAHKPQYYTHYHCKKKKKKNK